jgi:hypothetical protein
MRITVALLGGLIFFAAALPAYSQEGITPAEPQPLPEDVAAQFEERLISR